MAQTQQVRGVATNIRTENGYTIVRYHNTDVVKFNDKEIILNSGGWRTNTTKTRMDQTRNQFNLPFAVFQKNYEWYVHTKNGIVDYFDGMIIKNEKVNTCAKCRHFYNDNWPETFKNHCKDCELIKRNNFEPTSHTEEA